MPKMFILLNHDLDETQKNEAKTRFGVSEFVNLSTAKWSSVPPELDDLSEFLSEFKASLKSKAQKGDFLFAQGDFGAAFEMVCFGLNLGLVALYATTKREVNVVQENGKNVKKSVFKHIKFRQISVKMKNLPC